MKITREQLKEIIQEELEEATTESEPYKVGDLVNLLTDSSPEAALEIRHRYAADPFEVYETYTTDDGRVVITVQERER